MMTVATLHGARNDVTLPSNLIPKAEVRDDVSVWWRPPPLSPPPKRTEAV